MELKKRALILVSHGSKRTTWLRPFEAIREETDRELREELGTTVGLSVLEGLGKPCLKPSMKRWRPEQAPLLYSRFFSPLLPISPRMFPSWSARFGKSLVQNSPSNF